MSRNKKLYLSELILRLNQHNTLESITILSEKYLVAWTYKNKEQAIKDLSQRDILWNSQVNFYTIIDNKMQIVLL